MWSDGRDVGAVIVGDMELKKVGWQVGTFDTMGFGVGACVEGAEVGALTNKTGAITAAARVVVVEMDSRPGPANNWEAFCRFYMR